VHSVKERIKCSIPTYKFKNLTETPFLEESVERCYIFTPLPLLCAFLAIDQSGTFIRT